MRKYLAGIFAVIFPVFCCFGLEILVGTGGISILTFLTDNWIILVIAISVLILAIGIFIFRKKGGMSCDISEK